MSQVVTPSVSQIFPTDQVPAKVPSKSSLLVERIHKDLALAIFRKPDGSVYGTVNGEQVPLEGFPKILHLSHLSNALKTLSGVHLIWNGRTISLEGKLLGGGCTQSTSRKDLTVPLLSRENDGIYASGTHRVVLTHWNAPQKNSSFVGREPLLLEVKRRLAEGGQGVSKLAIAGLGGIGKTSLVIEYLHRNKGLYSAVWWISGENPMSGYRELGESLGIVKPTDTGDVVLEKVKKWLEVNRDWILIFDNVEDYKIIAQYLPENSRRGHILTTSRDPHIRNSLVVGIFSQDESINLLTTLTEQKESEHTKILAKALGNLPLALTQAGGYMQATKTSFEDYLPLFEQVRIELWKEEESSKECPITVGTTWNISVRKIEADMPGALKLLYAAAYLAPDNIPKALFTEDGVNSLTLSKYLHKLQSYCLFAVGLKEGHYSVHRLVQTVTRDKIQSADETKALQNLLACFKKEWTFDSDKPATWPQAKSLFEHLAAFSGYAQKERSFFPQAAKFLNGLGQYSHFVLANLPQAISFYKESLTNWERVHGPKHPEIANNLSYLGAAYQEQGNIAQSESYHRRSLEMDSKPPGKEDTRMAISLRDLGDTYLAQSKIQIALEHYNRALKIQLRIYGEPNTSIANTLNSIGTAYKQLEQLPLAIDYFTQVLKIDKKFYSSDHPKIAVCLNNLGEAHLQSRNFSKAIDYLSQALEIIIKLYDEKHPHIASTLNNLGLAYKGKGKLVKAIDYYQKALAIRRSLNGNEHFSVAESLNNLGAAFMAKKDYPTAIDYLNQALVIDEKTYGKEHPNIAITLWWLGTIYSEQRNRTLAIDYHKRALAIFKKAYGDNHPKTLSVQKALVYL